MQTRVLVTMLIYSNATAAESPQTTALQPERKRNRVKTLLHSSSRAALADVNGPYQPDAHPVGQLMALERTMLMRCTRPTAARKSPHDRLRGGACTDQNVLPTLPGCIGRVLLRTARWLVYFILIGGFIASPPGASVEGNPILLFLIGIPLAFVCILLQEWDSYLKAHRNRHISHHEHTS